MQRLYLNFISYLIFPVLYCNACFPTPQQESQMFLLLCPTLSGSRITISTPTPDAFGVFTATAACDASVATVQFDGATPNFPTPQTITCNSALMQWTYNNGGVQTPFSTIECICPARTCTINTMGATLSAVTGPDDDCIYYQTLTCFGTGEFVTFYPGGEGFPDTYDYQCTGGDANTYYISAATVLTMFTSQDCI